MLKVGLLLNRLVVKKASYLKAMTSNYSKIRVTLNTKLDTLCFVKVGGPMEGLTNKYI